MWSYPPPKKNHDRGVETSRSLPAKRHEGGDSIGGEGGWLPGLQKPTSWIPYKFPTNSVGFLEVFNRFTNLAPLQIP